MLAPHETADLMDAVLSKVPSNPIEQSIVHREEDERSQVLLRSNSSASAAAQSDGVSMFTLLSAVIS